MSEELESEKKKKLSLFSTVMFGLSAIIGSGWMFGSSQAAKIAGPAAILAWIIGAILVFIIAIVYVEIGTMFPEDGAMSRFSMYTHGSLLGHIASWANWLSLLAIMPIEAVASVQYMSSWPWSWAKWTGALMRGDQLSLKGLVAATIMLVIFMLINYWSVSLMAKFNNAISIFKIFVPIVTMIALISAHFSVSNLGSNFHEFMPNGTSSVFLAISSAGIIFSYVAFQTVINLGNDIKKPAVNIRRGIVISLLISAIIYISLQFVFIGSLPSSIVSKGWGSLDFNSPYSDLAILLNIYWLSTLIYFTAFISPFGSGMAFSASAGKSLASMPKNHHMPKILGKTDNKYDSPRMALILNFVVSFIMILLFKNWTMLSRVVSATMLISLLTGPVVAGSLRKIAPDFKRPTKIKGMKIFAPLAFDLISLAIYWTMFPTTIEVIAIVILGLPVYVIFERRRGFKNMKQKFNASLWMIFQLIFLSCISWIGGTDFGGLGLIRYPVDFVVILVVSTFVYYWAVKVSYRSNYFESAKELNATINMEKEYE
ncbi:APC family permease [Companilactobacillus sp.]|jgi:amino acid transporter|uniref:APC family permease n=1 Tax=Companilactobacillus sp. TaxID=2767905 RepID=UPI0025C04997|nr:APC family permease [Companilactobacillus sp.]MCH4008744.1 APC family permease [Companilactobacillus sp.]MCH4051077.1 APC family permease [Companilactobacillus sp.]MCH4076687.1 APC family permease [Companilactobacillus sp.]MCH4125262.1 APC family permease [Companilactobacillus sp.]MCH4131802.1 APC family permease [Companilactobacillus sp.]